MTTPGKQFLAWLIWALAVLFYLYEYAIRIAPSVMVPELEQAFHINAAMVGVLSACYLYIYAPMQVPVGLMMDRWGPKTLLSLAALACGVGSILFGSATALWVAYVGRILMGLGSAFGFIGVIYVSTHWFGRTRLPWLIGIGNSLGMLGAVVGQGPAAGLVVHIGWRSLSIAFGVIGLVLAVAIFLAIKRGKEIEHHVQVPFITILQNLKAILRLPSTWINAGVAFFFYSTTTAFAGLWAVPCLQSLYGMPKAEAGIISTMIWVGWIIGGPLLGLLSSKSEHMKPVLIVSSLCSFIVICLFLYVPGWPVWMVVLLFFLLGIFLSGELATYSLAVRISPPEAKGTAPGLTNFFALLSGSALQPIVGALLDLRLAGRASGGLTSADYRIALTIFPISLLIACLLSIVLRSPATVIAVERQH